MSSVSRFGLFATLCVIATLAIGGTFYWAKARSSSSASTASSDPVRTPELNVGSFAHGAGSPRRIYYRYTGLGPHYGRVAVVEYGNSADATFVDSLSCEALHVGGNRGICMSASRRVVTTYTAKLFDANTYEVTGTLPLSGVPSRTRVSADGQLGATTVFVTGHGYDSVDFSTQTLLIDMEKAQVLADLETFAVVEDGRPIANADFNFWGVTFTPDGTGFYATLSTGGRHMLVKGDIATQTAEVIHYNVECPSLSPDGTRVAYKKRFVENGRITWQLHVLDIRTLTETPLAERRSIDDQLEWLDGAHVLYSVAADDTTSAATTEIWIAAADGSGSPSRFLRTAYSPAVLR